MKKNNDWIDIITLKVEKKPSMMIGEEAISKPESAIKVFKKLIGNRDQEVFSLLSLNIKGQINHYSEVHVGTLNNAVIHPREIFKRAILSNAHSIIIGHNHPSGDLSSSESDIRMTKELVQCGRLLDIRVQDHIIVSDEEGISIREEYEELFHE